MRHFFTMCSRYYRRSAVSLSCFGFYSCCCDGSDSHCGCFDEFSHVYAIECHKFHIVFQMSQTLFHKQVHFSPSRWAWAEIEDGQRFGLRAQVFRKIRIAHAYTDKTRWRTDVLGVVVVLDFTVT